MGMTANFKVLSDKEYSDLTNDVVAVEDLLFPEDIDDPFEGQTDLDKDWHTIHYLLTGELEPTGSALGIAVLGGKELGEDLGYGPARLVAPQDVTNIATALAAVNLGEKYDTLDKSDPKLPEIYCSFEFFSGEKEHLVTLFAEFSAMYADAAKNNAAVLAYLA